MDDSFPLLKARVAIGDCTLSADGSGSRLPTCSMVAYSGGPMMPDGWNKSDPLVIDISGMIVRDSVPINSKHALNVGHTVSVDKGRSEIKASGVLSLYSANPRDKDPEALEARLLARGGRAGFPYAASVECRYDPKRIDFVKAGETVNVNGRNFQGPLYVARKTKLQAISILARTAAADGDSEASIASRAVAHTPSPFLHSQGIACRLGKLVQPVLQDRATGRPIRAHVCYELSTFDAAINCTRSGHHVVKLNAGHGAPAMLDTKTGLYLWRDTQAVRFAFYDCPASRNTLKVLAATGLRYFSIGVDHSLGHQLESDIIGSVITFSAADLSEISALSKPGADKAAMLTIDPRDLT